MLDPIVPDSISTGKWFIWVVTSWTTAYSQVYYWNYLHYMDAYSFLEMKLYIIPSGFDIY